MTSLHDHERAVTAQVTKEEAREAFRSQLTEIEDWLYMDPEAESASAAMLLAKLATLTAVGDPIKTRVYEMQRRPERVEGARSVINMVALSTNSWPETRPWLDPAQISELRQLVCNALHCVAALHAMRSACMLTTRSNLATAGSTHGERLPLQGDDFRAWLDDVVAKQEALSDDQDPAFTIEQLQDRFEPVSRMFARLNAVPAPKPAKAPAPAPADAATTSGDAAAASAAAPDDVAPESEPDDAPRDELR